MKDIFGRFTPDDTAKFTLDSVFSYFSDYTDKLVVSYETDAKRPHYHFVLFGIEVTTETLRARIKRDFSGQVYLSGKDVQDKVKTIAYTIKDGFYKHNGLDINTFLMASVISKPKVKFDSLIKEVQERYITGIMTDRELVSHLLDIHIRTDRKIYLHHIKAQALLIKLKKESNKDKRELLIERILDDI